MELEYSQIVHWLQTTFGGQAVFAVFGSLIAALIFRYSAAFYRLTVNVIKKVNAGLEFFAGRQIFLSTMFVKKCHDEKDTAGIVIFFIFRFSRLCLLVLMMGICLNHMHWSDFGLLYPSTPWPLLFGLFLIPVLFDLSAVGFCWAAYVLKPTAEIKLKFKDVISDHKKLKEHMKLNPNPLKQSGPSKD